MMTDLTTVEEKIAARIDSGATQTLSVSSNDGGLAFRDMAQVMEFAKILAISGVAVPKHLRGNPGACLAVAMQAIEWRMSPYAVANKSYSVNDRLAFEAQLIAAVVLERSPIVEEPDYTFDGAGDAMTCTVAIKMRSGKTLTYTSPQIGKIPVKNSPLWKGDPQQQLAYYSIRAWARRHQPNVILGVYSRDEIEDSVGADRARDVTSRPVSLAGKLDALAAPRQTIEHQSAAAETRPSASAEEAGSTPAASGDPASTPSEDQPSAGGSKGSARPSSPDAAGLPEPSSADDGGAAPDRTDDRPPQNSEDVAEDRDARLADAVRRARENFRKGMARKAVPGEYREPGREDELQAYLAEFDHLAAAAKVEG